MATTEAHEYVLGVVTGLLAAVLDDHGIISRNHFADHLEDCARENTIEGVAELLTRMAQAIRNPATPILTVIDGGKSSSAQSSGSGAVIGQVNACHTIMNAGTPQSGPQSARSRLRTVPNSDNCRFSESQL